MKEQLLARIDSPVVLDDLLLFRVSRLLAAAGGIVVRVCEGRYGITRREWRLIAILAEHGPLLSSELAAHAHLQRSRTSAAVSGLVAKKLLDRRPRADNRRLVGLTLTDAGKALHSELMPFVVQLNKDLLSVLSHEEAQLLDDMLERMQREAEHLAATRAVPKANRQKRRAAAPRASGIP